MGGSSQNTQKRSPIGKVLEAELEQKLSQPGISAGVHCIVVDWKL